ncbi:hypothetical protein DQ239_19185 [Blastococcus sp. TF02-09]|nr:hypothetical protein DQ239_19185 [Blastococcus sp. TF02-9]
MRYRLAAAVGGRDGAASPDSLVRQEIEARLGEPEPTFDPVAYALAVDPPPFWQRAQLAVDQRFRSCRLTPAARLHSVTHGEDAGA